MIFLLSTGDSKNLEYYVQFWTSQYKMEVAILEYVHQRAWEKKKEKIKEKLKKKKLWEWILFSLEKRRFTVDLIHVYKYLIEGGGDVY